ncbi:MAG: UvrB/UvrC motif-containing protein [Spirochaetota bacterium]|nr:UvrB/UvrC motif-containing protein [Spirochaetota bacterium]
MICERCGQSEATIHLTEIVKDIKSEVHLCEECARMNGLNTELSNFSISLPEMLSFLEVGDCDDALETYKCVKCNLSYLEYKKKGKLGCPDCYKYLWSALEPVISSYHCDKKHIGKFPLYCIDNGNSDEVLDDITSKKLLEDTGISELARKLEIAVLEERYEDAAQYRDKIKEIESVK